jgi:hypothetical protein
VTAKKMKDNGNNQTGDREDHLQKIESMRSPFSQERLNEIFKISLKDTNRVISRESSNLEFKEAFGWKSLAKYLKTCAAFANAKGGYIVFGIGRCPHKLLGLSGNSLQQFEGIDAEKISGHFNEHFSPEIKWDIREYELKGNTYGLLYIYECLGKPVVCKKDADNLLKEGDIYYRYRGRSERIKYSELRDILDLKRENEQRLWMQHLSRIAKIGVREVGIFDLQTGQVTGTKGSFLIDESLLSQLSFIKEGEFSEIKGKPTLKLIGNMEVISGLPNVTGRKRIVKTKGIRISDIILAFLNLENVEEPLEYLKQICFETTAFLPTHFFMESAGLDNQKTIDLINEVISRSQAKSKLIERLQRNSTQYFKLPRVNTAAATKKRKTIEELKQKTLKEDIIGKDLEHCLQTIRSLNPDEVKQNSEYLRKLLRTWFNKHYSSANSTLADNLRRAICWVDEALYMKGTKQPCCPQ